MRAADVAAVLGGHRSGDSWVARCPGHEDHKPSFSIRDTDDGKLLVRCFAGCSQERVIAALRSRGLWSCDGTYRPTRRALREVPEKKPNRDDARRSRDALAIWQSAIPAPGTLVETYLASRGLHHEPPPTLRFCAGLKHRSGGIWPAMVALVTRGSDDTPVAVHRTFLARDGGGKARIAPQKMMLGPCRGGAVQLAASGNVLMVGEGIETCLAAMQATGNPAWAALSTSGLRSLELPKTVRDIIVLADGDEVGEAAARDCARRWTRQARRVRIARPPQGMDFNDLLVDQTSRIEVDAR